MSLRSYVRSLLDLLFLKDMTGVNSFLVLILSRLSSICPLSFNFFKDILQTMLKYTKFLANRLLGIPLLELT